MPYQQQPAANDVVLDIMQELQDITNQFQSKMVILRARQKRSFTQIANAFEQQQRNRGVDGQSDL